MGTGVLGAFGRSTRALDVRASVRPCGRSRHTDVCPCLRVRLRIGRVASRGGLKRAKVRAAINNKPLHDTPHA